MNKHKSKYHDADGLATIPTSLRKASAHPQEDRSCFLLKESSSESRKRAFHVAEVDRVMSEVNRVLYPAYMVPNISPFIDEDLNKCITTKCICGFEDWDDDMVECSACNTVQHFRCYYVNRNDEISIHENHFCVDCRPRPLDKEMASTRQVEHRERRSEYLRLLDEIKRGDTLHGPPFSDDPCIQAKQIAALIRYHGSDWNAIALDMKNKTPTAV